MIGKGNSFKQHQERLRLDIRNKFLSKRVSKHWNRLSMAGMSLEVFTGVALEDML